MFFFEKRTKKLLSVLGRTGSRALNNAHPMVCRFDRGWLQRRAKSCHHASGMLGVT
jgi:hypothetical protein